MGTFFVNGAQNSAALQNCAFLSTLQIDSGDPTFPFHRMMEMSMLGVGVGFDTRGAGKVAIQIGTTELCLFVNFTDRFRRSNVSVPPHDGNVHAWCRCGI